jgi:UbiD family decarboxylase
MKDLREFIERVKGLGQLQVIEGADWNLEIGAVTQLVAAKQNPPLLLFDKIKDHKPGFRICTIPLTTDDRSALALGLPLGLSRLELIRKLREKFAEPMSLIPPLEVKEGPVLENVYTGDDVDLYMFPTPKWAAPDGGRYVGVGDNIILRDPDEGWVNVSGQRIQVHDKSTATIYFEPGKHGGMIREKYWGRGQSCPAAVTLGGDPLLVEVGGTRIPWGMPEYSYAGWLKKEPVEVIKGPMTGLPIPAYSEIALEGEMLPPNVETRPEGPFSEWTGHFSPSKPEAAFKVKCILHRNNPIILGRLPFIGFGVPTGLHHLMRPAQVWNELDRLIPGVKGVCLLQEFGSRAMVISLEQRYGGHAKQAALMALGFHSYNLKYIIVVDEDVDPTNLPEVVFVLALRADPERFDFIKDAWGTYLDPLLSPEKRAVKNITHTAMIILACKPLYWIKDFPQSVKVSPELKEQVKEKWRDLLK